MILSITKVDLYALIFTVNTVTMPPSKSNTWKYFKRSADDKTVKCTLCSSEMTYTGGTTNMLNHLRLKHLSEQKPSNNDKQFSMDSFVNSPKKLSSSQSEKITQAIADMIIKDYIPLSIVESESFVNLMQIVAPDYKVPSRNTVKSRLIKRYDDERDSLVKELNSVQSVSLTTDTWTSNATESYITVTEHHITDDWEMQSNVLMTRAMPERHTGENLANKLLDCASEFELENKVESVVHDNARNMQSASDKCEDWGDIGCFGHTLQLCVKPALELQNVSKIVSKCRKLVGHFKHATTLTAEMRNRQKLLGVSEHELIQDVPTRWNSTHLMLERLCEQRRVITDILLDDKFTKKGDTHLLLKDHEWEVISDLVNVLKDFTKVTAYMSTETNVSCSQIYPIVCGLLNTSLRIENSDSQLVRKVKETIADELNRRYQPTSSEIFGSTAAFSTILDPRYKRLPFFNSEQRKTAKDALESRLDEIPLKLPSRNQSESDSAPSKRQRTESSLDFLMCYSPEKQEQDDELDRYLACKCDSKPLVWWKEHEKDFPRIALITKKSVSSASHFCTFWENFLCRRTTRK